MCVNVKPGQAQVSAQTDFLCRAAPVSQGPAGLWPTRRWPGPRSGNRALSRCSKGAERQGPLGRECALRVRRSRWRLNALQSRPWSFPLVPRGAGGAEG